ncbi:AraC-like DNA-binding protein [Azospirillum agricola]|uniref:helix-turn-helix transcriptional regulator n=1 Tax=Azospirillum agricola TaxID=1720247 RepID=UPI001F3AC628|nr:helix-turn-helix transcriptional regulator [Azospirillum agricola]MBP2227180.1 AraC-like DNA-binding protein [Azospirillum agricola]
MAFVEAGSPHSQMSDKPNRSLIVDLDPAFLEPDVGDRLIRQPFVPLPPAAGKLVDYMGLLVDGGAVSADNLRLWLPLLLDSLLREPARPPSRLAPLLTVIEPELGLPWTTDMMAERARISVSRLHALFRAELDTTPRAWLAELRLKRVCEWLALSDRPIAEIAYRAGFADQSALTRAMRRATGSTPAAYRRRRRETMPKNR